MVPWCQPTASVSTTTTSTYTISTLTLTASTTLSRRRVWRRWEWQMEAPRGKAIGQLRLKLLRPRTMQRSQLGPHRESFQWWTLTRRPRLETMWDTVWFQQSLLILFLQKMIIHKYVALLQTSMYGSLPTTGLRNGLVDSTLITAKEKIL